MKSFDSHKRLPDSIYRTHLVRPFSVNYNSMFKVSMQDDGLRDFEKIPPLVEFSLQKN